MEHNHTKQKIGGIYHGADDTLCPIIYTKKKNLTG